MIQFVYLFVLIICLSFAVSSFLLAQDLQKRMAHQFFVSYFYYVLCYLIFGIYSIAGHAFFQYLFGILEVAPRTEQALTALMMFFGAPFLITSWIMIIKTGSEMGEKSLKKWMVWLYFVLSILVLLTAGLYILYQKSAPPWHTTMEKIAISAYLVLDAISHILFFILALLSVKTNNAVTDGQTWKRTFGGLVLLGMVLRTILILFNEWLPIHTLLYLLIFFVGLFIPVLYLRWITNRNGISVPGDHEALNQFYSQYNITKREVDVVTLICRGKSNQEIAEALFISLQTVKDHTHRIYQKTGVNTRMQLAHMLNAKTSGTSKK